jgi:hypothetical protein
MTHRLHETRAQTVGHPGIKVLLPAHPAISALPLPFPSYLLFCYYRGNMFGSITNAYKYIQRRWWKLVGIRLAETISSEERDVLERYGEQVIGTMIAGGFSPDHDDLRPFQRDANSLVGARAWLTERSDLRDWRDRWVSGRDLVLEIVVIALIGWEIHVGIVGDRQQAESFGKQQDILTNLQKSSKDTADILAALKTTTETMSQTNAQQLQAIQKSETQAERTAKASEDAAQTASKSLDFSQRAYVSGEIALSAPPKVGEKLHLKAAIINTGKTPAVEVISMTRFGMVGRETSTQSAHDMAFSIKVDSLTSKTTLASGARVEQPVDSLAELTEDQVTGIEAGSLRPYIFVLVTYRDLFGHQRKTEVCQYYDPKFKSLMTCDTSNNAE